MRRTIRHITHLSKPSSQYDKIRRDLKYHSPYLPVIMEACRESQLSYEYSEGIDDRLKKLKDCLVRRRSPHNMHCDHALSLENFGQN